MQLHQQRMCSWRTSEPVVNQSTCFAVGMPVPALLFAYRPTCFSAAVLFRMFSQRQALALAWGGLLRQLS